MTAGAEQGAPCAAEWRCRDRVFRLDGTPLVMGIVNVTPDSFSDGGRYADPDRAVAHAEQLLGDGADLLDVGGESTRPGADPVPAATECERVVPVIEALARRGGVVLSVDTTKRAVAEAALAAGAHAINDISAFEADPGLAGVARAYGAGVILMHRQGTPRTMQQNPVYGDVVAEVRDYLEARAAWAESQGLDPATLAVDPGIGFGKTAAHNVALLAGLAALRRLGRPLVVGVSRKRFLEALTGRPVAERLAGTLAAAAFCVGEGAQVLRVHDVRETRDAMRVLGALWKEKRRVESGGHS